jgi:hypothetical protein
MNHTFVAVKDGKQVRRYEAVRLRKFEPKERKY